MKKLSHEGRTRLTRAFEALGCAQACLTRARDDFNRAKAALPVADQEELTELLADSAADISIAQTRIRSKLP